MPNGLRENPGHVASAFVSAWNARDADAIAALFEDDAEFVNVVGLWWHDRESIRKAHAYGLTRIFGDSTAHLGAVKVRHLAEGVALVHARMRLEGQTPAGSISRPGARANVFTFVMRRGKDGWRCASAHNTDVVPGAETNILDERGVLRVADYRAGPSRRLIDVSHTIEHEMVTYKGLPAPIICDWMSREASRVKYAPGTGFQIGKIEMVANTGTYVDSPFHRYEKGKDLSELPLESVADLECVVVRMPEGADRAIDRIEISASDVRGRAVLFHTGWDRNWRTDAYFENHPHLTARAAEWLVESGARFVGIDSFNIDSVDTGERPVHSILLAREIPICEHMRGLARVPERGGSFTATPVKVKGFGTFPVRAFVSV